jgi:hypothetical protein
MSINFYDIKIEDKNTKLTIATSDESGRNDGVNFYAKTNYNDATYFTSNYMSNDSFSNISNSLNKMDGYESDIYYNKENDTIRFSTTKNKQNVSPGSSYFTGISLYRIT